MANIDQTYWTIETIADLSGEFVLDETARVAVQKNRDFLEQEMSSREDPIYGVNTGFGSLCDTVIDADNLGKLQLNLVRSHAAGMGDTVNPEISRLMLLLKAKGLSLGKSGIRPELIDQILGFLNAGLFPVVYEQGSLGASGDLAPLAHLAMALIGEGEVWSGLDIQSSADAVTTAGLKPYVLGAKEGLALLNGTQFMSAHGAWALMRLEHLGCWADLIAGLSAEAFSCRLDAFDAGINQVRGHKGQAQTSENVNAVLQGTSLQQSSAYTQDPYSFRCLPQVHGASKDTATFVKGVIETEINSVTDNPLVLDNQGKVISGGNFHGQPLALAFDHLALAIAELGSISERRGYKLLSGTRGLNPFLADDPGLESGYMIAQYSAASIVSQNKQLATPASIDSVDSSNGQEDHVSMGANGATRLVRMIDNLQSVLGVELLLACKACEQSGRASGTATQALRDAFREAVLAVQGDAYLHTQMSSAAAFINEHSARTFARELKFFV